MQAIVLSFARRFLVLIEDEYRTAAPLVHWQKPIQSPAVWEFLWRETDPTGKRLRRTAVIGTVEQFPNEDLALAAVNGFRVCINEAF